MAERRGVSIHWFRKGLRLHDNPALLEATQKATKVYPIFIIDPHFAKPDVIGINRYSFLLQSLRDLDVSLQALGSRLFVVKGKPEEQLPLLAERWGATLLTFESDTEPYAKVRDDKITTSFSSLGKVAVSTHCSHTIFPPEAYLKANKGKAINSYGTFCSVFESLGTPRQPLPSPTIADMPPLSTLSEYNEEEFRVPTLQEMGYVDGDGQTLYPGGETEALRRMRVYVTERPEWVSTFEKPNTAPNSLEPSTTVLSPYIKFGCLSAALFYQELSKIYEKQPHYTKPPVSLHGQMLWREFFYLNSVTTPNFHKMVGNPNCKQIPWGRNEAFILAFKEAQTGYPFIDAIMTQLKTTGWIHHLARHAVACFFTRGDLWQHWEEGMKIFDLYLLDADYALNCGNWQWLSCSNFFNQFFRCYSPIAFGKKTDPDGNYIRKWIPKLAKYPKKYIFEPWEAPLSVQKECGCIIGKDYPAPIVKHDIASQENMAKMKAAYALARGGKGGNDGGDEEDEVRGGSKSSSSSSSSSSSFSSSSSSSSSSKASSKKQKKDPTTGTMDAFVKRQKKDDK